MPTNDSKAYTVFTCCWSSCQYIEDNSCTCPNFNSLNLATFQIESDILNEGSKF